MLVHVKRDELLAIAAQTAKAAPKTATSEAVLGIHVEADSRRSMLTLTATNYEIVIRASMGASVEQSGSVVISAALFPAAISERLAEDHIRTWSNEGDLVLAPFDKDGTVAKIAPLLERRWLSLQNAADCDGLRDNAG